MQNKYRIEFLDKTTLKEQVSLYNQVFEQKWSVEEWEYINYQNPLTTTVSGGNVIGAFDGKKLIGLLACMDMQYVLNNIYYKALQIGNISVHIDYRHQGILTSLVRYAEEFSKSKGYDFLMVFPNRNSHPAFQKIGWTDLNGLQYLVLQANTNNIVSRVFNIRLPGFMNVCTGYVNLKSKIFIRKDNTLRLQREYSIPEGITQTPYHSEVKMTLDYPSLAWRFKEKSYVHYTIRDDNNNALAYFVVREHPYFSLARRADIIASYHFTSNRKVLKSSYGLLLTKLRKEFDIILEWNSLSSKENKLIRKALGYFNPHLTKPYMVKILTEDLEVKQLLSQKESWDPREMDVNTTVHYVEDE